MFYILIKIITLMVKHCSPVYQIYCQRCLIKILRCWEVIITHKGALYDIQSINIAEKTICYVKI